MSRLEVWLTLGAVACALVSGFCVILGACMEKESTGYAPLPGRQP